MYRPWYVRRVMALGAVPAIDKLLYKRMSDVGVLVCLDMAALKDANRRARENPTQLPTMPLFDLVDPLDQTVIPLTARARAEMTIAQAIRRLLLDGNNVPQRWGP